MEQGRENKQAGGFSKGLHGCDTTSTERKQQVSIVLRF